MIEEDTDLNIQDEEGDTALMRAAYSRNNVDDLNILIKKGAEVNIQDKNGDTVLMRAARWISVCGGDINVLNVLIKAGANLNIQDKNGKTALMCVNAFQRFFASANRQDEEPLSLILKTKNIK